MIRLFSLLFVCLAVNAEVEGDWPRWRGPFDTGVARGPAPFKWSDTENIAWKIAIPGKGHSSPVIWGDRIFVSTAVPTEGKAGQTGAAAGGGSFGQGGAGEQPEHKLMVMAIDRATGKVIWERTPRTVKPHEGYHQRYGSYASNQPVTDGKRLYVSFGSRGVYCYDLDGKLLWDWDHGVQLRMRNSFGEGTGVVLDRDLLFLLYDHQGEDFMVALDTGTGKPRWKVQRPEEPSNWSAPLVLEHDGVRQAVVPATNKVRSYDVRNGELLWEVGGLGLNTIPMPVTANGIVYVMSGFRDPNLLAVRLGRRGDLTGTDAVIWSTTRGTSYTPSPVLHDGKLYMLTDSGLLSCLDAATGKPYYDRVRLPKPYNFKSSLVAAGDKLYLSSEDSDVIVVRLGPMFEVLATNTLNGHSFIATPAVAGNMIYLRSETHLFAIKEK